MLFFFYKIVVVGGNSEPEGSSLYHFFPVHCDPDILQFSWDAKKKRTVKAPFHCIDGEYL